MSQTLRCCSISLGCPKNRVDTERLLGSLGVKVVPVEDADRADLVFINTCAFIQPAIEESVRTIAQTAADIEDAGKKRPLLVVAGCLVGPLSPGDAGSRAARGGSVAGQQRA